MSRPEALRRARELREEYRSTREPFTQDEFCRTLTDRCADLGESALEGLVAWAAEAVDKQATRERTTEGPALPGFDLDGEYRLGKGLRIAKADAKIEHIEAALAFDDANVVAVQQANIRKRQELMTLRPYLRADVRKAQAVQAWLDDHPSAEAGA